jgi:hypothetical protein
MMCFMLSVCLLLSTATAHRSGELMVSKELVADFPPQSVTLLAHEIFAHGFRVLLPAAPLPMSPNTHWDQQGFFFFHLPFLR